MFHPDLHEQDPEKRKTYERLMQVINDARDRGDIELLELIAKDPQAFILQQGWASVSLDVSRGLVELRSLYEHLQARILEMIETLDEVRASTDFEVIRAAEEDESVIGRIVAAQREELSGRSPPCRRRPSERRKKRGNWRARCRFRRKCLPAVWNSALEADFSE